MKISHLVLALVALSSAPSFAGVLQLKASGKEISGVQISSGGKMVVEGRTTELTTVGAGLRKRMSLFSVYVGELLVNDSRQYVCKQNEALASLKNLNGVAVRLVFLRAISMSDLQKAFNDGFENNDLDANNPDLKKFQAAVQKGGDIPNGATLAFTGEKLADGVEAVTYENAKKQAVTIKGGAGFVHSVFSLWLGNPGSDSGLKSLMEKFTSCQFE